MAATIFNQFAADKPSSIFKQVSSSDISIESCENYSRPTTKKMTRVSIDQPMSLEHVLALSSLNQEEDLSKTKLPFVWKLYEMLDDVEKSGKEHIVSWVADGKAFRVHKMKQFVEEIIPDYFKQSKYKSFQRQLYFYQFTRIASGPNAGAYEHAKFVRGIKTLCLSMTPKKSRNSKKSAAASKKQDSAPTIQDWSKIEIIIPPKPTPTENPSDWMTQREETQLVARVTAESVAPARRREEAVEPPQQLYSTISEGLYNGATTSVFGSAFHFVDTYMGI